MFLVEDESLPKVTLGTCSAPAERERSSASFRTCFIKERRADTLPSVDSEAAQRILPDSMRARPEGKMLTAGGDLPLGFKNGERRLRSIESIR